MDDTGSCKRCNWLRLFVFIISICFIFTPSLSYSSPKIPNEHQFHPIIVKAANFHNIDPALIKAIIKVESGYNPKAISRQGARGLMQLMPDTAKKMGVEDSFNPEHNINAGVKYFKLLLDEFDGEVELALAAYQVGIKKVKRYGGVPPFKTTRRYINKVLKYFRHYQKQHKASFS